MKRETTMQFELKQNEFTDQLFLDHLKKRLKHKGNVNKNAFTMNDVNQYCKKGKMPKAYGGSALTITYILDKLRIIKVEGEIKHQPKKAKKNGSKTKITR